MMFKLIIGTGSLILSIINVANLWAWSRSVMNSFSMISSLRPYFLILSSRTAYFSFTSPVFSVNTTGMPAIEAKFFSLVRGFSPSRYTISPETVLLDAATMSKAPYGVGLNVIISTLGGFTSERFVINGFSTLKAGDLSYRRSYFFTSLTRLVVK